MLCLPDVPPSTHPPLLDQLLRKSNPKFYLSIFCTVHCVKLMKKVVIITSQIIFAVNTKLSATPARFACPTVSACCLARPLLFTGQIRNKYINWLNIAELKLKHTIVRRVSEAAGHRSSQSWIFIRYVLLSIPLTILEITYSTIPSYRRVYSSSWYLLFRKHSLTTTLPYVSSYSRLHTGLLL